MRSVTAELAAAITAPERTVRARLSVDWDGDGHGGAASLDDISAKASSVTVASVLQGTWPEQVSVVEGTAAATLDVDLAAGDTDDEQLQAVSYFSPTSTSSPLAGKQRLGRDVRCNVEFLTSAGWESVPLLRGTSRALRVAVASRQAHLAGIDYRSRLRTPVALPAMAADVPAHGAAADTKPGLEGTWVASYALAQCGFPVGPPARAGCRLHLPMHGSAMPFVQKAYQGSPAARIVDTSTALTVGPVTFAAGPFSLATARQSSPRQTVVTAPLRDDATVPPLIGSDTHCNGRIELWVQMDGTEWAGSTITLTNPFYSAVLTFGAGAGIQLVLTNPSSSRTITGPAVPTDGAWHRIAAHWQDGSGVAILVLDDAVNNIGMAPLPIVGTSDHGWTLTVATVAPVAEIHVTAGLTAADAYLSTHYTPAAVLDRSANSLDGIVPGTVLEGWQILQDLAAAEQGAAYLDADGIPHYATRARLVSTAAQVPQRTIDATRDMFDLALDPSLDRVANVVTADYQPLTVSTQVPAWTLGQTVLVPAGQTYTIQASYSGLATSARSLAGHANTKSDGTGTSYPIGDSAPAAAVTASITYVSDTAATIVVTNTLAAPVWLVGPTGTADLTITGDTVAQSGSGANSPVVANAASRAQYQDLPITLPSNTWVQQRSVAAGMAMATAGDLAQPQAVITDLPIPGDPRLEPFDRITALDPDNTGLALDLWYVGGTHTIDASGHYVQQIVARPARTRFLAGTGIVGTDLVG